jgi:hypothetical protein
MTALLEAMRAEYPAHAEYVERLIAWCKIEGPKYERASVACEAVRNIVHVGDEEWAVLVETFGEPTPDDWWIAQQTYGPNPRCPSKPCDACGEPLFGEIAEVVRWNIDAWKWGESAREVRHLLVHEPCFDRERMVLA